MQFLTHDSMTQRACGLMKSERLADVRFVVGKSYKHMFAGHRLILAMGSPVFEKMFYGSLPAWEEEIDIPDIDPTAFKLMLHYMYSNEIHIFTVGGACDLLYAATKYMLDKVVDHCVGYLMDNMTPVDACRVYETGKLFDNTKLMELSMELIVANTTEVICAPSFLNIDFDTLITILDQDELNIKFEVDLLNSFKTLSTYVDTSNNEDVEDEDAMPRKSSGESNIADEVYVIEELDIFNRSIFIDECMLRRVLQDIQNLIIMAQLFINKPGHVHLLQKDELFAILNIKFPKMEWLMPEGLSQLRNILNPSDTHLSQSNSMSRNCTEAGTSTNVNLPVHSENLGSSASDTSEEAVSLPVVVFRTCGLSSLAVDNDSGESHFADNVSNKWRQH